MLRQKVFLLTLLFVTAVTMSVGLTIRDNSTNLKGYIKHHGNNEPQSNILTGHHNFTNKLQKVVRSISRDPFNVWFFKDRFKSFEDLLLTPQLLRGQVEQRNGTMNRLKEVIRRSLLGENFRIAVMGGSISAGGGLTPDNESLDGVYHRVFVDWWQKTVEPFTGSTAKLRNLAIGGTGSNFFSYCYSVLLNPLRSLNLALLDFTVNDFVLFKNCHLPMSLSVEQLTREILSEQNSPAVIFVNFVQGQSYTPLCNNLENHGQAMVAQNYKITTFSLRSTFCSNHYNKSEFLKLFSSDGNHVSVMTHAQIAMMMINYVRKTMLHVINSLMSETNMFIGHQLSTHGNLLAWLDCPLNVRTLPERVFEKKRMDFLEKPLCYTRLTPDGSNNMTFFQSLVVNEIGNVGFRVLPFMAIASHEKNLGLQESHSLTSRTDAYSGWEAKFVNSMLQLELFIPSIALSDHCLLSNVTLARKLVVAVRTSGKGGKAMVWLNDYEERGIMIDTFSWAGNTKLYTVSRHVVPGRHVLSLRTSRNGTFILSAVMVGPINQ